MLLTARIPGFLLLLLLLAGYKYAAGNCDLVVSEIKTVEITSGNRIGGRKMASDRNFMKMEMAKDRRKRSRILNSSENYGARFVAFNADYKGPRHHPPKNN